MILFSKAAAPFVPFIADHIYKSLTDGNDFSNDNSVHLTDWPERIINETILKQEQDVIIKTKIAQTIVS